MMHSIESKKVNLKNLCSKDIIQHFLLSGNNRVLHYNAETTHFLAS